MRPALLVVALAACAPPEETPDGSAGEVGTDTVVGDTAPPVDTAVAATSCDVSGGRDLWLIERISFAEATDGVSDGFDLDGDATPLGGEGGCGRKDYVGPEGQAGIDNAFAGLLPALAATEFVAADELLAETIRNGSLLLVGQLAGLDDPVSDDCVGISILRGLGVPMVGTDGAFLAGQTLDRDQSFEPVELPDAPLIDGRVIGRPFSIALPIQIINATIEFELLNGAIRFDLHDDGTASGVFAGGLDTARLVELASTDGVNPAVAQAVAPLVGLVADLAPDASGTCTQLSVTMTFTATPIYFYDDVWGE